MKNRARKSKQGPRASTAGEELRPSVPGQDSPFPKVRSSCPPPSFSRLYQETHRVFLQGSVVEGGAAICSKYHFRHGALITDREVGAKEHDIVLWSFFCTHVQASATTSGLVSSCSSQSGALSPAENPQSFPLLSPLHLAHLMKSGPGGTKAGRWFIFLLCLQEEKVFARYICSNSESAGSI